VTGEEFGHMAEVVQTVVDRRRCQQEKFFFAPWAVDEVVEEPVTRGNGISFGHGPAGVAEVVGFVDDDGIGQIFHAGESFDELAAAAEIGVVEHCEAAEVATAEVWQIFADRPLPDVDAARPGNQEHHALPLVHDEAFDHHESDECFAKANAVAQERPAMPASDFQQRLIAFFLILIENAEHARTARCPG